MAGLGAKLLGITGEAAELEIALVMHLLQLLVLLRTSTYPLTILWEQL